MKKHNKKSESINSELIFPIYIDTRRVKDSISIMEEGFHKTSSISEEGSKETGRTIETNAGGNVKFLSLFGGFKNERTQANKNNRSYENEYTDAYLFYKVLNELLFSKKVKRIENSEDFESIKEGDIVLCEGQIYGNEMESFFNKILLMLEALSAMGQCSVDKIKDQLLAIKTILRNSDEVTDTCNMVLKLGDGTELMVTMQNKYLIDESGVELVRGKYKLLGVVFEKYERGQKVNLARDSLMSLFDSVDINKVYGEFKKCLIKINQDIPEPKTEIKGPSLGIMPIGVYL